MAGKLEVKGKLHWRIWRITPWMIAALLLLSPLVAMQFITEVSWDKTDLAVMGTMLFSTCGAYELAARMTENIAYRAAVGVAVVTALFLIWINLAVGIIGPEDDPANLMYGGGLAVGILGALFARFRPRGMVRALITVALAQAVVGAIALVAGLGCIGEKSPGVIVFLTSFFVALWPISAWLFRRAATG